MGNPATVSSQKTTKILFEATEVAVVTDKWTNWIGNYFWSVDGINVGVLERRKQKIENRWGIGEK